MKKFGRRAPWLHGMHMERIKADKAYRPPGRITTWVEAIHFSFGLEPSIWIKPMGINREFYHPVSPSTMARFLRATESWNVTIKMMIRTTNREE